MGGTAMTTQYLRICDLPMLDACASFARVAAFTLSRLHMSWQAFSFSTACLIARSRQNDARIHHSYAMGEAFAKKGRHHA